MEREREEERKRKRERGRECKKVSNPMEEREKERNSYEKQ